MASKTSHISVLQFNDRLITRLRVRKSPKGLDVLCFDVVRGTWNAEDGTLAKALEAFAHQQRLADDDVFTVLPRHDMTARILVLPSQDAAELASMVRLSAEEFVPFPADELVMDQSVLELLPDGQSKVLAVFAHREVVDTHLRVLREAHIEPRQIFLSTACLTSLAAVARGNEESQAWVNLAPGGLEVAVFRHGKLEYGRAVASNQTWDFTVEDGDAAFEEMGVEAQASLSAYRRESEEGESVEAVYLCGECAEPESVCGTLEHELGVRCAPASFVAQAVTHGADHLPGLPAVLLGAALLAQGRGEVPIRLLPAALSRARQQAGAKRLVVKIGALAAGVLLALALLYGQAYLQRKAYIGELEKRIAAVQPRAMGIVAKRKQLKILQEQVERSGSVVELLASLVERFPASGMNLTRFLFSHNEGIEVYGRANSLLEIEQLTRDLIAAGKSGFSQFARAEQAYEHTATERNQEIKEYKIILPFSETQRERSEGGDVE